MQSVISTSSAIVYDGTYRPTIKIMLEQNAIAPIRAHEQDAGLDLRSPIDFVVPAHGNYTIDSGVHIEIPNGYVGVLKSKSGLNVKHDITCTGTIDAGYIGSIVVKLYNHGDTDYPVRRGDKITQLVILPIMIPDLQLVSELEDTERGVNGFGSTGR